MSFLLLTYQHEAFVHHAVTSALAQSYSPLEIIVSDDCSQDRTFEIVRETVAGYGGSHRVVLNRNERNLGLASNFNRALSLATGDFFVLASGDDVSLPHRTETLVSRWLHREEPADMVCSMVEEIDAEGKPLPRPSNVTVITPDVTRPVQQWECVATGACAGFDRKLYDKYGSLDERVIAEDLVLPFRAWLESGIALIEEPLVLYRRHSRSLSQFYGTTKKGPTRESRRSRRRRIAAHELARALDWQRSWRLARNGLQPHVERQFNRWVALLTLQLEAYNSGRIEALALARQCLGYRGGLLPAVRILVRNALHVH